MLEGTSADGLAEIVQAMCEDFRGMRDGFPDLVLVRDGKASFVEVKAEGDAIRRNQLTCLRRLEIAGISAEISRVDYRFDPEQDYVVVETEPREPGHPAITSLKWGRSRWHSLVHRSRRSLTLLLPAVNPPPACPPRRGRRCRAHRPEADVRPQSFVYGAHLDVQMPAKLASGYAIVKLGPADIVEFDSSLLRHDDARGRVPYQPHRFRRFCPFPGVREASQLSPSWLELGVSLYSTQRA